MNKMDTQDIDEWVISNRVEPDVGVECAFLGFPTLMNSSRPWEAHKSTRFMEPAKHA